MCVCVCVCVCTHIHAMKYYLAIKKNKILPFTTTQMDMEGIMLSEISHREKNNCMIYVESEKDKFLWHHLHEESIK